MEKYYDIFISYKRKSLPTANNLYYRLTTRGYSVFFDLEEMGRDNFNTQLLRYIENAKDVFVILEDGSLDACKSSDWEKDWFCNEISYALEKEKNIIPILLDGYQMPDKDFLPEKLKSLSYKNAPEFSFTFFEAYLDKLIEKEYLISEPSIQEKTSSVFKFYSNDDCQVFKEGRLVCSLEGGAEEPYYLPVSRKGDYRFKGINSSTAEITRLKEHIDANEEKEVDIEWDITERNDADVNSYYALGNEHYYGLNGKKTDYSEAVYWYRKAAEKGHVEAIFSLASCYNYGKGTAHDYKKAKVLFEKAAALGHMEAQYYLGRCYKKGFGTSIDPAKAFQWFLKSAKQGYALAQNNVGVCYEEGIGVNVDEQEAIKWYLLSYKQGDEFAHDALVRLGVVSE